MSSRPTGRLSTRLASYLCAISSSTSIPSFSADPRCSAHSSTPQGACSTISRAELHCGEGANSASGQTANPAHPADWPTTYTHDEQPPLDTTSFCALGGLSPCALRREDLESELLGSGRMVTMKTTSREWQNSIASGNSLGGTTMRSVAAFQFRQQLT
jgi:hypothetical protein